MSLFRSSLRPPTPLSDDAIERYVAAVQAQLDPDPLFRRRLRGHVLNRFVAAREGIGVRGRSGAKEMTRIGRAVLYASVALAVSVSGAVAASQQSVPGDGFYRLKLDIEAFRVQVLPERFHDELAAYALGQRIDELRRLAEQGNWSAVAAHASAVGEALDLVVALSTDEDVLAQNVAVAQALLERLPEAAREAVIRASGDNPGLRLGVDVEAPAQGAGGGARPDDPPPPAQGGPSRPPDGGNTGGRAGSGSDPSNDEDEQHPSSPDGTPRPEPQPRSTAKPAPTPKGPPPSPPAKNSSSVPSPTPDVEEEDTEAATDD